MVKSEGAADGVTHAASDGLLTLDEALRRASNPDEFKLTIQGIQSTSDISPLEAVTLAAWSAQTEPTDRRVVVFR